MKPLKIHIINGPNLNLIGKREVNIYGKESFDDYIFKLKDNFSEIEISYYQSNIEGEIIDEIQKKGYESNFIIINPGGYSHTSIAILDAIRAVPAIFIEVHLSNVFNREEYRHKLITASGTKGTISGFGLHSYYLAIEAAIQINNEN